MRSDTLEVVYGANDGYARHLGVSLCSLFDRNRSFREIRVHVLSMGISRSNKQRLQCLADAYGRTLVFVEMERLEERLRGEEQPDYLGRERHLCRETAERGAAGTAGLDSPGTASTGADSTGSGSAGPYDISVMLRLFMGEMLPQELDRVLYLDCDTVVLQSLKRLWRTELGDCLIGAVMEPSIYPEVKSSIGLGPEDAYYNSGVLLVDLAGWRKEAVQRQLLAFWQEKGGQLFASDQDVLNGVLKGRIRTLPPKYNFFTNYRYFSYQALTGYSPAYSAVSREQFQEAKAHPVVVHYMGDERPWIAGNRNHYRKAYESYLARTPWAGTKKEPGKRMYMLAYHGLDYATAVCPALRWKISEGMGMRFAESRKNTSARKKE